MSRFKFIACVRNQGESVSFVARLRQLTEHCSYGTALEEMLRDRIVGGINDERLQRRLLAEPELTFTKAVDLAQAYESAAKDATNRPSHRGTYSPCVQTIGTSRHKALRHGAATTVVANTTSQCVGSARQTVTIAASRDTSRRSVDRG